MKSYFSLLFFISILSFSGLKAAAVPHSFSNGSVANADHINENFNAISANVTHLEHEFNAISDNILSLNNLSHSVSILGGNLTTHNDLILTAQNNLIQLISKDVQIDNEIAVISGNISSITHELHNISGNINNLNALSHNVTVLEGNLTSHNDLIATAQNNLIQLISKDIQIDHEIAVISGNISSITRELDNISANINNLNGLSHNVTVLEGSLTTHNDLIATAQNNLIQLISNDIQIDNEIAVISGNISSITHELDIISANINNLNGLSHNVTVLEGNLTTHNDLIVTAQSNLIQLITKDYQIDNEIAVISGNISSITHELDIISANINNLNGLNHDINDLTGKMIQISGNIENVKGGSSTNIYDISAQLNHLAQNMAQISGNLDSFISSANQSLVEFGSRINLIEHPVATSPPTRLTLPSGSSNYFGRVAVDGNKAIVGAPSTASGIGAIYFYQWDGSSWVKEQEIHGEHGDLFGNSVAMSENSVIVGAPFDDDKDVNAGAVYFYEYNGHQWVLEAKATLTELVAHDTFGDAVAIHKDKAIIGAKWDDDQGTSSGCAYLYHKGAGGWVYKQKIDGGAGTPNYRFGHSVGIHNDRVIVSAPEANSSAGKVYWYKWDGSSWVEETVFAGAMNGASLGQSVSIHNDKSIVGAPYYNTNKGRAYLYALNSSGEWTQERTFDGTDTSQNGFSVAIRGDYAISGAPFDDQNGPDTGAVNVYKWDGANWNFEYNIIDTVPGVEFGFYTAISNEVIIIGNREGNGAVSINPIQHHSSVNSGGLMIDSTGGTGAYTTSGTY